MHWSKRVVVWLEGLSRRPAGRPLAGLVASLAKSAATGQSHWCTYNRRGYWVNKQRRATFFSPTLHTATIGPLTGQVDDFWCYGLSVGSGATVVDVGAGIGDHVLVFSRRVKPSGRVIAIEAHPETANCLKLTVAHNQLDNTVVFDEAAWDRDETLRISDEPGHERNAVEKTGGGISIRARRVDDMLAPLGLQTIDLLKMNIEGAEVTALSGMPETLARTQAVVISCHDFLASGPDDSRRTKTRVMKFLGEAGFSVLTRPDAPLDFLRDYVYGRRR